jgi:hypothetical protein
MSIIDSRRRPTGAQLRRDTTVPAAMDGARRGGEGGRGRGEEDEWKRKKSVAGLWAGGLWADGDIVASASCSPCSSVFVEVMS